MKRRGVKATCQVTIMALLMIGSTPRAEAGNGPYNKDKKTFQFTYIFLDLPGGNIQDIRQDVILSSRSNTPPTPEQTEQVARFMGAVSDMLMKITGNRASIESLTETKDIEKADVVISLSGSVLPSAGGAFAMAGTWNKTGSLNLYYDDLVKSISREDVVETVVHELCHYLFGLPDEYANGSRFLCPPNAPQGCLMDNYHNGWNGRLCVRGEHNASAPGANGTTPFVADHALSCQEIVDKFFNDLGAGAATTTPATTATPALKKRVKLAVATRSKVMQRVKGVLSEIGKDASLAMKDVRARLLPIIADELDKAKEIGFAGLLPKLVDDVIFTQLGAPLLLKPIADFLEKEALKLARSITDPTDKAGAIHSKLLSLANSKLGTAKIGASPTSGADETQYLSMLAQKAAEGTLVGSTNAINMRSLGKRESARSTVIIEPPILSLDKDKPRSMGIDEVPIQGNLKGNYNQVRELTGSIFASLVDRDQITALSATSADDDRPGVNVAEVSLNSAGARNVFKNDIAEGREAFGDENAPVNVNQANRIFAARKDRLNRIIDTVKGQIEKDQVDNIVVLIPPGGIGEDFNRKLEGLASAFIGKSDLRLDVAVVGSAAIPDRLRDFVDRTSGTILTVTDLDEVGAVAQRLAGEQTQGTWISIPEQGMLTFPTYNRDRVKPEGDKLPLYERLAKQRYERSSHPIRPKGKSRVVLRPFYLDGSTKYDLIFGLSREITVPGLSRFVPKDKGTGKEKGVAKVNPIPLLKSNSPEFVEPEMHLVRGRVVGDDLKMLESSTEGSPHFSAMPALDLARSTPNTLVFSLQSTPDSGVAPGWYTPVLIFDENNFREVAECADHNIPLPKLIDMADAKIHFTFSVGTPTTKGQLVANLIQDLAYDATNATHGAVGPGQTKAVVTAVLSAGAGVIDAEVKGFFQVIDSGRDDILINELPFNDKGEAGDEAAGDGVYTGVIGLETPRAKSAEFRVFIEGVSTPGTSKFVPGGEALPTDPAAKDNPLAPKQQRNPPAPGFQRATSINFLVPATP